MTRVRNVKREQSPDDIAEIVDTDEKTVRRWCADGCPHTRKGRNLLLNDGEVLAWMKQNNRTGKPGRPKAEAPPGLDHDKDYWLARKYKNQCLRDEGVLVDREERDREWMDLIGAAKNQFLGLPDEVSPALYGREVSEISESLRDRIEQIFRGLQLRSR